MTLHTVATGTAGPRIAYLHGLFGQGRNWTQIAKGVSGAAGTSARGLLVDLPNHGRSPWTEEFSFQSASGAVVETLEASAPGEQWTLVGHSLGGKTAMMAALARPDLIERLCIVDIAPRDYGGLERFAGYVEEMVALPLGELTSRADAEARFEEPNPVVKAFLLQNLRRDGDQWRWQHNLDLVARDVAAGAAGTLGGWPVSTQDYEPYPHPVLWIVGGDSDYVTDTDSEAMRELFPLTRQLTVKGAGHWVHSQAPEIVIGALRRLIR